MSWIRLHGNKFHGSQKDLEIPTWGTFCPPNCIELPPTRDTGGTHHAHPSTTPDRRPFRHRAIRITALLTASLLIAIVASVQRAAADSRDIVALTSNKKADAYVTLSNGGRVPPSVRRTPPLRQYDHSCGSHLAVDYSPLFEFPKERQFTIRQVSSAQDDDNQRWVVVPAGDGSFTIRQLGTRRFLDAYQYTDRDFSAVTRDAQHNDSNDYDVVTRPAQGNDTQRWTITHSTTGRGLLLGE